MDQDKDVRSVGRGSVNQDKDVRIEVDELRQRVAGAMERILQETVDALNNARDGAIIADSEWPVRDAAAKFGETIFETGVQLKVDKAAEAAFSPSAQRKGNTAS
jgi:hypothetical protein